MKNSFPHLGLRVAYDGKIFSGFQLQPNGRSVQAEIEKALSVVLRMPIRILFSSRTDSGVHAYDQWIMIRNGIKHLEKLSPKAQDAFLISVNALLPAAIRVWSGLKLRHDFNFKTVIKWKEYRYRVLMGPICDPLLRDFALWTRRPLDVKAMKKSFSAFEGEHDFKAFAKRVHRYENRTIRKVLSVKLISKRHPSIPHLTELIFIVRGTGFLHHMVRTMVGTMLEIGNGVTHDIPTILRGGSRKDSGVNAPPQGLMLWGTSVKSGFAKPLGRQVNVADQL